MVANTAAHDRRGAPHAGFPPGTPTWIVGLQQRIDGFISVPGMPNYADASAGIQLYPARPAAVAFCTSEHDVAESLAAAQDNGIEIRARSGRHSFAGYSNVDDGLVIDVSPMNHVAVDHPARTATVGAGANLGQLNAALDVYMLHVPGGARSAVGVAGHVQGGGFGFTSRRYGMTCDRVAAVRVMLADGRVVRATPELNQSLLWAVCGGTGGNFGVLIDVTYDLVDLYRVWAFALRWPIEQAPQVLAVLQDGFTRASDRPDALGLGAALATIEGAQALVVYGMFAGDREGGVEAIAPLQAIGRCTITRDECGTYADLNERVVSMALCQTFTRWYPAGILGARRSGYVVRRLGIEGWTACVEYFKTAPGAYNVLSIDVYGGRLARIPQDDCAFVHRAVDMCVSVDSGWSTDGQDSSPEQAWEWVNGYMDLLAPFRDGSVYQNYPERGLVDYRTAYWGANFERLLAVKRIADPADVFAPPQGITPDPAKPSVVQRLGELEPEQGGADGRRNGRAAPGWVKRNGSDPVVRRGDGRAATLRSDASALNARLGELSDLGRAGVVLAWDQQVMMPAGGGAARAAILETLRRRGHEALVEPELGVLLGLGDSQDSAVRVVGRDHERARRVPTAVTEAIFAAASDGMAAWLDARVHNDFGRFEPALRRNVDAARAYAECFEECEHPYDALLDRYEPEASTAVVGELLARVCDGLAPLLAEIAVLPAPPSLTGPFPVASQRAVALEIAAAVGFDEDGYRLDTAVHPFACSPGAGDVRVAGRFEEAALVGLFTYLHELGHALYERGIAPALSRTTLDTAPSVGVHESQSRLWECQVGRGKPFWSRWLPALRDAMPDALDGIALEDFVRAINPVRPTLIRVDADELTYPFHILLRFELEVRLIEGTLDPADVPAAWAQRTRELLGIEVPDDMRGALQDIHWAQGIIGYFPTYMIGTVLAAQMWSALRVDLPTLDDDLRAGRYAALCDWLHERVHRHGRTMSPSELIEHVVGGPLDPEPMLAQMQAKYRALYGLQ
jgi:carboxypeptidase Taq